jgi:hypothetical protein
MELSSYRVGMVLGMINDLFFELELYEKLFELAIFDF